MRRGRTKERASSGLCAPGSRPPRCSETGVVNAKDAMWTAPFAVLGIDTPRRTCSPTNAIATAVTF